MPQFKLIVLGCDGGPLENDLSCYLLAPHNSTDFITIDAGTLLTGIEAAYKQGLFEGISLEDPILSPVGTFFHKHIKGYLLTHVHLDHLVSLIVNSQVDCFKPILALDPTIDALRDHLFNGIIWPKYGNEGEGAENRYNYVRLKEGKIMEIPSTALSVEAFSLNHGRRTPSTAFLFSHRENYFLHIGDTASDFIREKKRLEPLWKRIAPLIREQRLCTILIECSVPNSHGKNVHLNPELLMQEMHRLAEIAQTSLKDFQIIVTHRKQSLEKNIDPKALIEEQLARANDLGLSFIFPSKGDCLLF